MGVFLSVHRLKDPSKRFSDFPYLPGYSKRLPNYFDFSIYVSRKFQGAVSITNKTLIIPTCNVFNSKKTDSELLLLEISISRNCPSVG